MKISTTMNRVKKSIFGLLIIYTVASIMPLHAGDKQTDVQTTTQVKETPKLPRYMAYACSLLMATSWIVGLTKKNDIRSNNTELAIGLGLFFGTIGSIAFGSYAWRAESDLVLPKKPSKDDKDRSDTPNQDLQTAKENSKDRKFLTATIALCGMASLFALMFNSR